MSTNQFESCQTGKTNVNHKETTRLSLKACMYNATKLSDFNRCMLKKSSGVKQHEIPPSAWISDGWVWDLYISYSLWLGPCIGILVIQYKYIHIYIYTHPTIAYMYIYISADTYVYIQYIYIHIYSKPASNPIPTTTIQPMTPAVAIVHESSVICKARQKRSKATVTRCDSCSNSTKPEGPLGRPRSVPGGWTNPFWKICESQKWGNLCPQVVGLISFFQKKMKPPWKRNL